METVESRCTKREPNSKMRPPVTLKSKTGYLKVGNGAKDSKDVIVLFSIVDVSLIFLFTALRFQGSRCLFIWLKVHSDFKQSRIILCSRDFLFFFFSLPQKNTLVK